MPSAAKPGLSAPVLTIGAAGATPKSAGATSKSAGATSKSAGATSKPAGATPKPGATPKSAGATPKPVALDSGAFAAEFNMALVHEAVRAEQAARRQGTHSTKTRGQVSGGGAKPWKQKGTGRARAGSSRNPVWTGGGTVFGPQPRHYIFKVNRKARRAALRSALSVHAQRGSVAAFDAAAFSAPATKQAKELLAGWAAGGPRATTLVLLAESERDAGLSFRNLERVVVLPVQDAGVSNVIGAARLLVSEAALPDLVARATGTGRAADEEAGN